MTASRWVRRWSEPATTDESVAADPDHAWKALTLANEWLRHAETKLATTLAAAGVTGGVLFNLVRTRGDGTALYNVSAVMCFSGVIVAGLLAIIGLFPRLRLTLRRRRNGDSPINPLFFHDVASAFKGDAPGYTEVLRTLTTDPNDLIRHLAHQVHANSVVAQRKYRWANGATRALVVALVGLAVLAGSIALRW